MTSSSLRQRAFKSYTLPYCLGICVRCLTLLVVKACMDVWRHATLNDGEGGFDSDGTRYLYFPRVEFELLEHGTRN